MRDVKGFGFYSRASNVEVLWCLRFASSCAPESRVRSEPESPATRSAQFHLRSEETQTAESVKSDRRRVKVVIADDERIIADTLASILNDSGFEARAVYSGEAAVEVLGSFEPDLLLSDVVMPGMGGVEAAIAVRSLRPKCKVLLFSGQGATSDLLQEARARGHDFELIWKPTHPADLLAKLRSVVRQ